MKLCLAQTKPHVGDVEANIYDHQQLIHLAVDGGADLLIFPELSITGYEPTLAKSKATTPDDPRFAVFQTLSDKHHLSIGIGVPIHAATGVTISLLLFQPAQARSLYSKQYLHPDEEPFFISGKNDRQLFDKTALAICYEISVPRHAADAFQNGVGRYIASVAKSVAGVRQASDRLSQIAGTYSVITGMANCLGLNDGMVCGGNSSFWNRRGQLVGQLNDSREGVLLLDTITETVQEKYL